MSVARQAIWAVRQRLCLQDAATTRWSDCPNTTIRLDIDETGHHARTRPVDRVVDARLSGQGGRSRRADPGATQAMQASPRLDPCSAGRGSANRAEGAISAQRASANSETSILCQDLPDYCRIEYHLDTAKNVSAVVRGPLRARSAMALSLRSAAAGGTAQDRETGGFHAKAAGQVRSRARA
jgi:hypothetical protein